MKKAIVVGCILGLIGLRYGAAPTLTTASVSLLLAIVLAITLIPVLREELDLILD